MKSVNLIVLGALCVIFLNLNEYEAGAARRRASVRVNGRVMSTKERLNRYNSNRHEPSSRQRSGNGSQTHGGWEEYRGKIANLSSEDRARMKELEARRPPPPFFKKPSGPGSVDGHTTPSKHGGSSEWGSVDGHTTPSRSEGSLSGSSRDRSSIGEETASSGTSGNQVFHHEPSLRSTHIGSSVGSSKSAKTSNSATPLKDQGIHTSNAAAQKYQELAGKKSPLNSAGEFGVQGGRIGPARPPVSGALAKEGQIAKPYGVQGGRIGPPKAANSSNWEMGPWKAAPKTNTTSGGEKSPSGYGSSGGVSFQPLGSY